MVSPEGKIIDVNQSALTALGYDEEELIGRPLSFLHAHESHAQMEENFREWKETGRLVNKEMTVLTKGGEPRTVLLNASAIKDPSGRFMNSVSVQTDITDLRKARVEAQAQEELLRQIAANFPHSYVSILEKDLTVGFTSGQEFANQGMNPDDFVGLTLDEVFGEHTPAVKEHYLKTFEGEETSFELFINNQHQLYRTVPLAEKNGRVDRILAVVENITERKEAEKKLKESEEQLNQSQKMEGIGRLALRVKVGANSLGGVYLARIEHPGQHRIQVARPC
jgi:PAS domain S-box-containing protein